MIKSIRVYTDTIKNRNKKISFWFTLPPRMILTPEIKKDLKVQVLISYQMSVREGFTAGSVSYDDNGLELLGWWKIVQ